LRLQYPYAPAVSKFGLCFVASACVLKIHPEKRYKYVTSRQSAADTVAAHGKPLTEEIHMGSSPARNSATIRRPAAPRRGAPVRRLRFLLLLPALSMISTTAKAGTGLCNGMRIPLDTSVLSVPFANLALGGRNGNFLLDTGATHSRVDMRRYEAPDGAKIFL